MPRTRLDPPNTRPAAGIVPTAAPAEDGGGRVWVDCWKCDEGWVVSCEVEIGCVDPESGCDIWVTSCDICEGKGGWHEK